MAKNKNWVKEVGSELRLNLEKTSLISYENGKDLLNDASILFEKQAYARCVSLAILAEEEFCKSFILKNCSFQRRWDSEIYKALVTHSSKQAISEGMKEYFFQFLANLKKSSLMHMSMLVPPPNSTYMPSDRELEGIVNNARKILKNPKRDKFKQKSLYVSINESAELISRPNEIERDDAKSCRDGAYLFQIITELQLQRYSNFYQWLHNNKIFA